MKRFLCATILFFLFSQPIFGMKHTISKILKNISTKTKNTCSKIPFNKKEVAKKLAWGTVVGVGTWQAAKQHNWVNEKYFTNIKNENIFPLKSDDSYKQETSLIARTYELNAFDITHTGFYLALLTEKLTPYFRSFHEKITKEQIALYNNIVSNEIESIPLELLQKLEKDTALQSKVIAFYFAQTKKYDPTVSEYTTPYNLECNDANTLAKTLIAAFEKHIKKSTAEYTTTHLTLQGNSQPHQVSNNEKRASVYIWEQMLSKYTLEELQQIKNAADDLSEILINQPPTIALSYQYLYDEIVAMHKIILSQREQFQAKNNDTLATHCRAIALQSGIQIPDWIMFEPSHNNQSSQTIIKVDKRNDGFFLSAPELTVKMSNQELGFVLGHEFGHIALGHSIVASFREHTPKKTHGILFDYYIDRESSADKFVCFHSKKACQNGIKLFLKILKSKPETHNKNSTANAIESETDYKAEFNIFYLEIQKRIKKMQQTIDEIEKEKKGLCKNPFYKQLGSNKWFRCKKNIKPSHTTLELLKTSY